MGVRILEVLVYEKTLNVGLVGYKFMGKAHSNGFQRIGMFLSQVQNVGMKSICGRDEAGVREAAAKFWLGRL